MIETGPNEFVFVLILIEKPHRSIVSGNYDERMKNFVKTRSKCVLCHFITVALVVSSSTKYVCGSARKQREYRLL